MKKNRTMRVAALLLALTLITSCFVGGTMAKYTTSVSASDSATVAKWQIKYNGTDISAANSSITFGLFDTIKDSTGSANETDVTSNLIAPGTSGSFEIKIENLADVDAKYTITFTESETGGASASDSTPVDIPIEYAIADKDSTAALAYASSITDITATDIAKTSGVAEKVVYWRWAYDGDHTSVGIDAQTAKSVSVTATIAVEQAD